MSCHKAVPELTVSSEQQHSTATSVPTRGPEPTWSERQRRDSAISLLKALFPAAMRPDRGGQQEDQSHPAGGQGLISLQGTQVAQRLPGPEDVGKHLFEISPGGAGEREKVPASPEGLLLMASSQRDMEDWVQAIRRVIWAPFGGGIFGQRLEDTVHHERKYGPRLAPLLVEQCVDFIRARGLSEEGLFRLPGQANLVRDLQDAFDCGEKPLFDSTTDVHTVASLLKLYLRELPEPVVPFARYEDFLSCAQLLTKDEGEGTLELAEQVSSLPLANYNLLSYICKFLDEVQSHSNVNKMSVQNLATVFGPNILRPQIEDPVTIMEGTSLVQHLMTVLIRRHSQLFSGRAPEGPAAPHGGPPCTVGWGSEEAAALSPPWSLVAPSCHVRVGDGTADLRKRMLRLEEELDQEKKKYTMLQIRLRNSERARADAERRNQLLQEEMEEFFSTLGSLTVGARGAPQ
ncbi:Rho GTPase-activating protein 22 [Myotis brandtii]|uniref:Rho GTPase-activating protein 22 n=1 Tax=Myotis brandtii TaxID=109478 RepID=S7MMA5_MYOBR|nr:Rho GTPase-activating protein 22 [Myotis brandtii]